MKQAYAIAYLTFGSVRCIYKATKSGAINEVGRLVGVEPIALTEVRTGRDLPHPRITFVR